MIAPRLGTRLVRIEAGIKQRQLISEQHTTAIGARVAQFAVGGKSGHVDPQLECLGKPIGHGQLEIGTLN